MSSSLKDFEGFLLVEAFAFELLLSSAESFAVTEKNFISFIFILNNIGVRNSEANSLARIFALSFENFKM